MLRLALLPVACALAAGAPSFEKDVAPILGRHCSGCHAGAVKMGNLDLSTAAGMRAGGSKGPAVVARSAASSLLYQRITDRSMPPGAVKLTAAESSRIREWIDAGAEGESRSVAQSGHWAFSAPRRPAVPSVRNAAWVRNPIDAFVLSALEAKGIAPVARADAATLLRRVHLSVTGVPPTVEEQARFEAGGYDRVVDELLARPQYGERWARRWLDVVRYAESNGYERDGTKPNVWRYRDWVIDSLNRDKPYDRFVTEQLAGDEMDGSNAETQIATTFLRLGTWDDEPAEPMLDRYDQLDDILGTTSAAFLGVTLRCARCHDHKFEPFTQKDYYRVLAVFAPLKRPQQDRREFDRLAGTEEELARYGESKTKADARVTELTRQTDALKRRLTAQLLKSLKDKPDARFTLLEHIETVLAFQVEPARRTKEQKALVEKFQGVLDTALDGVASEDERLRLAGWRGEIAEVNRTRLPEPPRAYVWYEDSPEAPASHVLLRGDVTRPGEAVAAGAPAILAPGLTDAPVSRARSTGRRLWLARWMTRPDNPLTARVIVNRLWQGHFGEGLVSSENDFGVMGAKPSHPELLDWLATELVRSGCSLKHIQRLIVTSNTFQLGSAWNEQAGAADPQSQLLWRWRPRRLDAEVVRDSMLAASGGLNLEMHGPSIYPELPQAVLDGQSVPGSGWGKSDERQAARRSVYIFAKRSLAVPELELLDAPDTTASCEQRTVSTTGPQALTFLNGTFTHRQAALLAARVEREAGTGVEAQVRRAFALTLNRAPTEAEVRAAAAFLDSQSLKALALVLVNSNEFMYLN